VDGDRERGKARIAEDPTLATRVLSADSSAAWYGRRVSRIAPWEQWRFDALVEAARRVVFGENWTEDKEQFPSYARQRAARIPFYLHPMGE
jgi:hypothetical protein